MDKKNIFAKGFPFASPISKEIPEKAIIGIFITITFSTFIIIIGLIIFIWQSHQYLRNAEKIYFKVAMLNSHIIDIDEVLTSSARLAAATSELKWEKRYNTYEPKLEMAIKEAIEILPTAAKEYQQIESANIELVEMERQAFDLVKKNESKKAFQLLQSPQYEDQKNIYTKNLDAALQHLSSLENQRLATEQKIAIIMIILIVIIVPLVFILWAIILRVLKKYIDQKRQNELALRLNEQRFRAIADYTYSWEIWISPHSNILWTNPAVQRVTGYSVEEFMKMPDSLPAIVDEENRSKVKKAIACALKGTTGRTLEFKITRKDGNIIWADMSWQPICDEKGFSQGTRLSIRDITAKKNAQAAEKETHRRLSILMSNLPGMAYSCENNPERTMGFFSEGCFELTGYQASDLIQNTKLSYCDLIHTDDRQYVWQNIQKAIAKKLPFKLTYRIKTADQKQKWVWEKGTGVYDSKGQPIRLEGFIADVTDRKLAEEKLRVSEERLALAFDVANDGMWDWLLDTNDIYFSPRYYTMLGYRPYEMPPAYKTWENLLHPDDKKHSIKAIKDHLQGGTDRYNVEFRLRTKQGGYRWILSRGKVVDRDENNKPLRFVGTHVDITDRKQSEDQIRKSEEKVRISEERLAQAFDVANDGMWDWNIAENHFYFSPRYYTMLGYEPDEMTPTYKTWESLLHTEDRNYFLTEIQEHLQGRTENFEMEYRLRSKQGDYRWILSRGKVIDRDHDGRPLRFVGTHVDITDRKQAEELIKESEEKYRTLIETMNEGMGIVDSNYVLTYVNEKFPKMLGYTQKQMIGKHLYDFLNEENKLIMKAQIEKRKKGYAKNYDLTWIAKDGHKVYTIVSPKGSYDADGNFISSVGIVTDVTGRKEIEQKLRLTQFSMDRSSVAVYWIDEKANFIYTNNTACEKLGYSQQELQKMSVPDIDPLFPMKNWPQHWQELKKAGSLIFESVHKRKDGSIFPVEITANYVKFEGKEYNVAFTVDITERKQADKERSQLLKTLALKNEELQSIIYAASHDLRSPLINIHGFSSELANSCRTIGSAIATDSRELAKKLDTTLNKEIPHALNYILNSASKMDSLLSGLLKISRLGSKAIKYKNLNMNKIMADIIKNNEYILKEAEIKVIVEPMPCCLGDPSQINQVFSNIFDNSIKHRDNSKKTVIKITGRKEGDKSIYCVEDNGIGIEAQYIEKIFEIFHRLDPEKVTGEGLGLTIVKRIVQRHNGFIWVESAPRIGSKFFVSLPNTTESKTD